MARLYYQAIWIFDTNLGLKEACFDSLQNLYFSGMRVRAEVEYVCADGKRYQVLHDDEFHCVVMCSK